MLNFCFADPCVHNLEHARAGPTTAPTRAQAVPTDASSTKNPCFETPAFRSKASWSAPPPLSPHRVHVELNDEVDDLLQGADQETKTTQNAQGGAL